MPLKAEFWANVEKGEECWLWKGPGSSDNGAESGYGSFHGEPAHAVSWKITHDAEIPARLMIMHSCDIRLCVRPAHLYLGSNGANQIDARNKGVRQRKQPRKPGTEDYELRLVVGRREEIGRGRGEVAVTAIEAAAFMQVSVTMLNTYVRNGRLLPCYTFKGGHLFLIDDVRRLAETRQGGRRRPRG